MTPHAPRKLLRCAIYTRKSTEHNLDLEFNSLDAQREACEAYIHLLLYPWFALEYKATHRNRTRLQHRRWLKSWRSTLRQAGIAAPAHS